MKIFTADMAYRQVALHMLRNPTKFYKYVEQELLSTGESYESYCVNVFDGNVWGDDLIAAASGDTDQLVPCQRKPSGCYSGKWWGLDISR